MYLTTNNTHYRLTSTTPAGFESTISIGERPAELSLIPPRHRDRLTTSITYTKSF